MRKRGFTFWEIVIVLGILCGLTAALIPVFMRGGSSGATRYACQSSLKQIGLANMQYAQDADGFYPRAAFTTNGTFGWANAIQPYLKSTQVLQCPREGNWKEAIGPRMVGYTDYYMNQRLSGLEQTKLPFTAWTILYGEGNDGTDATDARYSLDALPAAWIKDMESPANRHLEGANYGFVDGHVKWLKPVQIKADARPGGVSATFAPR